MWKFHNFSIAKFTQEINLWGSRHTKFTISTYLEALNFYFCEFMHVLKAEISQSIKLYIRAPEITTKAVLGILDSPNLISCKI